MGCSHIKRLIPWGGLIPLGRADPVGEGRSRRGGLIPWGRAGPVEEVYVISWGRADPVGRTDPHGESQSCEPFTWYPVGRGLNFQGTIVKRFLL